MKTDFRTSLSLLKSKEGSPVDLQRIQNESLRLALEEVRSLLVTSNLTLTALCQKMERRTNIFSPTKGFSNTTYQDSFNISIGGTTSKQELILSVNEY